MQTSLLFAVLAVNLAFQPLYSQTPNTKNFDATKQKVVLEEHILDEFDNVLITPHNAFNSTEALQRILDTTIDNINKFVSGTPINIVNKR